MSRAKDSTVVVTKHAKAESSAGEERGWISQDSEGKAKMKVLAVDGENCCADFLLWFARDADLDQRRHTHGGATYTYIIEGGYSLTSFRDLDDEHGTTVWYEKGDFVYQPVGQIHVENLGAEDTVLYVSNRNSPNGTIFEELEANGEMTSLQTITDLGELLKDT